MKSIEDEKKHAHTRRPTESTINKQTNKTRKKKPEKYEKWKTCCIHDMNS